MFNNPDEMNNETGGADLDAAIRSNMRDLERLASFYFDRGDQERAQEIWDALSTIRQQMQRSQDNQFDSGRRHRQSDD